MRGFAMAFRVGWASLLLFVGVLPGMTQGAGGADGGSPRFVAADVHASPHRSYPFYYAVVSKENRYVVRDATLVDLVSAAWNVDHDNVQKGPGWVAMDRFDIIAALPPDASNDAVRLMLRDLLKMRFGLAEHEGTAPLPAYVLKVGKDKPKMARADGGEFGCDDKSQPHTGPSSYIVVSCHNMTMDQFAEQLHNMAGGYLDKTVVNETGLDGAWNVELKWTGRGDLQNAGADGISIFDAVQKELGMTLALETAPRPAVIVDSAHEEPTPNQPDLAKVLPPLPPPAFEVATIKPSKPGTRGSGRITGTEVKLTNGSLKLLIDLAWDLNESDPEVIVGAPKWLDDEHFDLEAKVSPESTGRPASAGSDLPMDIYEVEEMLRALLIERFGIKAHMEDRPISAYTLVAVNPKMKAADPEARTECHEGPGPDGKDPRLAQPILNRLVSCRNLTMKQMCEELQHLASGFIFSPVADGTGLKGGYDFTLSFSSASHFMPGDHPPDSSDPNGALSLFDAVSRQLGLKLEKQKRPLPVLVLDHIEPKPAEN